MTYTEKDLLREIETLAWDQELSPIAIVHRIQGLLYTHEQNLDAQSGELDDWFAMRESMDTDPDPGAFSDESVSCY